MIAWTFAVGSLVCLIGQPAEAPRGSEGGRATRLEALLRELVEPEGLTLAEVARRAMETAPALERASARIDAAGARVGQAASRLVPQVGLRAGYTRVSDVDNPSLFGSPSEDEIARLEGRAADVMDPAARELWESDLGRLRAQSGADSFQVIQDRFSASASLDWSLTRTVFTAREALSAAGAFEEAVRLEREASALDVALRAARRFHRLVEARGRRQLAQASLARAAAVARDVKARVEAGAALASDGLRAEARLARARGGLVRAAANAARAARRLQTLLHQTTTSTAVPLSATYAVPKLPSFSAALEAARERRPALAAARARVTTAEAEEGARSLERLPDLRVSGQYRWARPNPRVIPPVDEWRDDWRLGLALAWSPTAQWRLTEETNQAAAEAREARARLAELEDQIRDQVASAHARLRGAQAALVPALQEVDAARAAYEVRLEQYRLGAATVEDTLEAERSLTEAEVRLLSAYVEAAIARHELRRVRGLPPVEGVEP